MVRRLFILLLLAVFGHGLFTGPHPCQTRSQEERKSQPSCHESAGPPAGFEIRAGVPSQSQEQDCCDTLCQHACHMTAIAEARPVTFAIAAPIAEAVVEAPGLGLPLFAHPIDHVPLV